MNTFITYSISEVPPIGFKNDKSGTSLDAAREAANWASRALCFATDPAIVQQATTISRLAAIYICKHMPDPEVDLKTTREQTTMTATWQYNKLMIEFIMQHPGCTTKDIIANVVVPDDLVINNTLVALRKRIAKPRQIGLIASQHEIRKHPELKLADIQYNRSDNAYVFFITAKGIAFLENFDENDPIPEELK